ncbi:MAG: hypothetical protein L3J39_18420 [Verrucomicrobiales bacterium]|nr:hypothetical protein [Verrucomicrobiales bacterium]
MVALSVWFTIGGQGLLLWAEDAFTGVEVDESRVVKQQLYQDSRRACGPTALINVLRSGTPKMQAAYDSLLGGSESKRLRFVIDRYFKNKTSGVFPRSKRFGHQGVFAADLCAAFNDLLKDHEMQPVTRLELDRREGEGDEDFLARVHGSLRRSLSEGVPPIIQLRSYTASREKEGDGWVQWEASKNHFVVVTRVPAKLRKQDSGFVFDAIDPNRGVLVSGYVYAERHLPYRASKVNSKTGEEQWLSGRPFLLVKAPGVVSLQPKKATWEDRVIVTLSEAIGRFGAF